MKARWLILPLLLALVGWAIAQSSVQMIPGDAGPIRTDKIGQIILGNGHVVNSDIAPAISSCGTTGFGVVGNDYAGTITVGTSATTTCTLTFNEAWSLAPSCLVGSNPQLAAFSWVVSTTTIIVTQTSTASNKIAYICVGTQ
jgi:hypothetical protein